MKIQPSRALWSIRNRTVLCISSFQLHEPKVVPLFLLEEIYQSRVKQVEVHSQAKRSEYHPCNKPVLVHPSISVFQKRRRGDGNLFLIYRCFSFRFR